MVEKKIRTGHTVLANQAQGAKEKSNSISTCPNLVTGVIKITQRCFTAIFELNKQLSPIKSKTSREVRLVILW